MSRSTTSAEHELTEDTSRFDRAVEHLYGNTGAPRERIREFLIAEVARLRDTAAVTKYIYVLATANIRTQLRSCV